MRKALAGSLLALAPTLLGPIGSRNGGPALARVVRDTPPVIVEPSPAVVRRLHAINIRSADLPAGFTGGRRKDDWPAQPGLVGRDYFELGRAVPKPAHPFDVVLVPTTGLLGITSIVELYTSPAAIPHAMATGGTALPLPTNLGTHTTVIARDWPGGVVPEQTIGIGFEERNYRVSVGVIGTYNVQQQAYGLAVRLARAIDTRIKAGG